MSALYPDLSQTNFPDSLDTFLNYLNITATDGPLIAQYQAAIEANNTTLANQILAQIPSASQKLIKATDLNKIMQSVLALERFYKADIQTYVTEKQAEWEEILGEFDYVGTYSSGTTYAQNNVVSYTSGGLTLLYIAIDNPPVGTLPTNQTYWRLLTIRGQQGDSGDGFSYRGVWDADVTYALNDCVTYDNVLWGAIVSNTNQTPFNGSTSWKIILQLSAAQYPIQPNEPASQAVGDLWFNTTGNIPGVALLDPLANPADNGDILNGYEAYDENGNLLNGTYVPPTVGDLTADSDAVAGDILSGKTAYVQGDKITGTLTVADLTDDADAVASDIANGKTAYVQGVKVTGNVVTLTDGTEGTYAATVAPVVSGSNLKLSRTIGSNNLLRPGSIFSLATPLSHFGTATPSDVLANKLFTSVGGLSISGTIPSQGAQTITPGTTNKTIASGRYLSGTQTIKGDANLVAGNIKSGVSIFGVTGNVTEAITGTFVGSNNHVLTLDALKGANNFLITAVAVESSQSISNGIVSVYYNGTLYTGKIRANSTNIQYLNQISGNFNSSTGTLNYHVGDAIAGNFVNDTTYRYVVW